MSAVQIFQEMTHHRKSLEKQKNIHNMLLAAFEVVDEKSCISPLQKEFLITELGYSYQHFGACLFSPFAVFIATQGLSNQCGVDGFFIERYLLSVKEFIISETALSESHDYFSDSFLEKYFAKEFTKRILCTKKEEDPTTGMGIFCEQVVNFFRELSEVELKNSTAGELNHLERDLLQKEKLGFINHALNEEFFLFIEKIKSDPLVVILTRLESFVHFYSRNSSCVFVFKENDQSMGLKSKSMAALMTLLIPHQNKQGQFLFPDSLVSLTQILKLLSPKFNCESFDMSVLRGWLDLTMSTDTKSYIEEVLYEACEFGMVFKVPHGNKGFQFGLTQKGLKILQPYHGILSESLFA